MIMIRSVGVFVLICWMFFMVCPQLQAKETQDGEQALKKLTKKMIGEVFQDFVAIDTGVVKDGEQIPLPNYGDGTQADRKECHYFVSPHEITTSMSDVSNTGGVYYIHCSVDSNGVARISFKKQGVSGTPDYDIAVDAGYKSLQEHYERNRISGLGGETGREIVPEKAAGIQFEMMKGIQKRLSVNYLVVAIRSISQESPSQKPSPPASENRRPGIIP
ncbi:MAG: hypothetical protein HY583_01880 [Candidatus Omnitrophica bacterium]|nr:hypothetical protein [Candidatus Omnitrophota bacterium]